MEVYAVAMAAVVKAFDLKLAVPIGHRTSHGEVTRYVAGRRICNGCAVKAVLVCAIAQAQSKCGVSRNGVLDDPRLVDVPAKVMRGEDDQIYHFPATGAKSIKFLKWRALNTCPSHLRMPMPNAELTTPT